MAQTEHLPIYKSAYDLCLHLEQVAGRLALLCRLLCRNPLSRMAHRTRLRNLTSPACFQASRTLSLG
jgi:hypothetical protein